MIKHSWRITGNIEIVATISEMLKETLDNYKTNI